MAITRKTTIKFGTNDGKEHDVSYTLQDGKDDYELWKEIPGNEEKTREDYAIFKTGNGGSIVISAEVIEEAIEG